MYRFLRRSSVNVFDLGRLFTSVSRKHDLSGAFSLVSSKRPCCYPNIGFQLQLHLFEKTRKVEYKSFNLEVEIVIWVKRKLRDVAKLMTDIFEDEQLLEVSRTQPLRPNPPQAPDLSPPGRTRNRGGT